MSYRLLGSSYILLALFGGILIGPAAGAISERAQRDCSHLRQPSTGQSGKDVVWMPTSDGLTSKMLELAHTAKDDRVFDLGAGDGRIPIAAAKDFGATAVGVEYDPDLVVLARCLVSAEGVADKVKIVRGDVFESIFRCLGGYSLSASQTQFAPATEVVGHGSRYADRVAQLAHG